MQFQQGKNFFFDEISKTQGFRLDVKTTAAGDNIFFPAGMDAVITDIAHTAEDNGLRKGGRAFVIAGTELPKHRDQGIAHQGIDFVKNQHQRLFSPPAPYSQHAT